MRSNVHSLFFLEETEGIPVEKMVGGIHLLNYNFLTLTFSFEVEIENIHAFA